jgi:hypothetical protein
MYDGISKIFRTDAVKIIKIINKRVWKLPTSTQLRATCHTDSLDIVVLPSTGDLHYHNCCVDGGTSPEYFGYLPSYKGATTWFVVHRRPWAVFVLCRCWLVISEFCRLSSNRLWRTLYGWQLLPLCVGKDCGASPHVQGDQKVYVHLMIIVQKYTKYFKQFQSLTMVT